MPKIQPFLFTALALAAGQLCAQTAPASAVGTDTAVANSAANSAANTAANTASNATGAEAQTVTVTARRVGERLIDVPLSIQVFSGKAIEERGISSLTELSLFTPGLSYSPDLGRSNERPVIRGISALRPEAPQPVSVFLDGVFMRDGALGLMLDDVQRVEIIKGPQSALYGRSTYAGAINYISIKPSSELKGKVQFTEATDSESSAFAAVGFPILKDLLAARVKVRHYEFGGQYTNTQTGKTIGSEKTNAAGLQLWLTPSPLFDALLSLDSSRDRDGLFAATIRTVPTQAGGVVTNQNGSTNGANGSVCNGRSINIVGNNAAGLPDAAVPPTAAARLNGWPCGAATFSGTTVTRNQNDLASYTNPLNGAAYGDIGGLDREINRGALTLNVNFGGGYTLTSQTAVTRQQTNLGADQSYNGVQFAPSFLGGSSWLSYNRDKLSYQSQEVRVSSPQTQPLTWLVGGFLYKEDGEGQTANGVIARNAAGQVITAPLGLTPTSASHVRNTAVFGRVQYEITPAMRASLELRSSQEQVRVGGTALGTATVSSGTCVAGLVCVINGDRTFKDVSPRFTLDYKASKNTLLYAQAAKGSKSGGFNTTPGLPNSTFAFDGEKINSMEAGFKLVTDDGRIGFNTALFRNNIDGLQLSNISTVISPFTGQSATTTIVNNVGKARTQGVEFDLSARALDWLTLSANYAYTDAKGLEGTEITNGTVFGGNQSVAGFTLPRSPKHSAAISAATETPLPDARYTLFTRIDVVHQSRRYAEIQNMIWADPFTHVNLTAGLRGKGWRVSAWVKNATNDDTSLNGFRYLDPQTFRRTAVDFLPRLRQMGVTANLDF